MKLISVKPAADGVHKYNAKFESDTGREKNVKFGAAGMSDYTKHKDPERRRRYIERHRANENWNDPTTPGALSRFLLWGESTSLVRNLAAFRNKFNL